MRPFCIGVLVLSAVLASFSSSGAVYYTSIDGNDANPGTEALPWRTIQKAVNTVLSGDTAVIKEGVYDERVTSIRGGSSNANRITFVGQGNVTSKGWVLQHPYITLKNLRVARWSGPSALDAMIRFGENADFAIVDGCTLRGDLQLTRTDFHFDSSDNSITTASGGLLGAGFMSGQTLFVGAATNSLSISNANRGTHLIRSVTDNKITVDHALVNQGPLHVYLSAAYSYALLFHDRSEGILITNSTFSNLGYECWWVGGTGHTFRKNIVEGGNGWDIVRYTGSNHVFESNWFRDSPLVVYQVSPDFSENWPSLYSNILFTNNFVENVTAVISSQKLNSTTSGTLTYARNVFIGTGRFTGVWPNTTFRNNIFLRVASKSVPVIALSRHALSFDTNLGATNAVISNNVFIQCGEAQWPWTEDTMGWYEISGPTNSILAEGNYVAGGPPNYSAKTGWRESNPSLNGGDPGFVNIANPLGPDGIPWTGDDGLQLLPQSKLLGIGTRGETPGAYQPPALQPTLPTSPDLTTTGSRWYVDNAATGANNGSSWANAWTDMTSIVWGGTAGVKPGDTVFISGGTVSKTYSSPWAVWQAGTADKRITIRVGQDAGHNGQVIFDGSKFGQGMTNLAFTVINRSYITLDGSVNGASKLSFINMVNTNTAWVPVALYGDAVTENFARFVTFSNVNNGIRWGLSSNSAIHNCYFKVRGDAAIMMSNTRATNYDAILVYSNSFVICAKPTGGGPDGIQVPPGVSVFRNRFEAIKVDYATSGQHPDFIQGIDAHWLKVFDNEFINIGDSAIDTGPYYGVNGLRDTLIYNNIFRIVERIDTYPEFIRFSSADKQPMAFFRNVHILNNLFADNDTPKTSIVRTYAEAANAGTTGTNNWIANNIWVGCSVDEYNPMFRTYPTRDPNAWRITHNIFSPIPGRPGYVTYQSTNMTAAKWVTNFDPASSILLPTFARYAPLSADNDFRILAADTTAVARGLNFSHLFSFDRNGNPRNSVWDIGPFQIQSDNPIARPSPPFGLKVLSP